MQSKKINRLYTIDLFRIICAIMVFLFHSRVHISIDYKIFNNFIGTSHIFMVAFFMLSGFSLFYVDSQRDEFHKTADFKQVGAFLKKRLMKILPLYFFLYFLYILEQYIEIHIMGLTINNHMGIIDNLILAPVEIPLLQSILIGSFSLLHNGGTWFISCIVICYIFYPYISQIVYNNSKKNNRFLLISLYLISSYTFLPVYRFQLADIYTNPLLRLAEFSIGVIIGKLFVDTSEKEIKKSFCLILYACYIFLCFIISFGVHFGFGKVEMYNFIAIPCFGLILYFCGRLETKYKTVHLRRIISILSENTYAFFLAQFFSWQPVRYLMENTTFFETNSNIKKFIISSIWTCFVTIIFHYCIEKPCNKYIKKSQCINKKI